MSFAHRTNVNAEVVHLDVLNGQSDAARAVGDGVSHGAVLESFMFDVVTQQLVVRVPPLHGQLGDVFVVLIVIGTLKSDPLTGTTRHSNNAACRHKSSL